MCGYSHLCEFRNVSLLNEETSARVIVLLLHVHTLVLCRVKDHVNEFNQMFIKIHFM